MEPQITFVVTSCGRFDLLAQTLDSFLRFNRAPIARYALVEDSGDEAVRDVVAEAGPSFDVLVNKERLGQLRSIDRAYETVTTPYIFHCEDDWRFLRGGRPI
jgi:GT2 family glycosyltransferase